MDAALADGDPRDDESAISAYPDVVEQLKTLNEQPRGREPHPGGASTLVNQQIADNGSRMVALAERAGDLQGQFVAWLSSQIGAPVARGIQAAGTPGVMARY
jgi:hypothetical protein